MEFKLEQIAFGAENPEKLMAQLTFLGCKTWIHDKVKAAGTVFGLPAENVANLYYNYDLGFELEILKYESGANWHQRRPNTPIFLSHIGMHVQDDEAGFIEIDNAVADMVSKGIGVAQVVKTISHSNPAIKDIRRYEYVVFDSAAKLGFDVKLIRRINL